MNDTNYKIKVRIAADGVEIEAQGDKAFVQEIFAEFQNKGTKIIPTDIQTLTEAGETVIKSNRIEKPKVEKPQSKKVPSRAPKFLLERRDIIEKFMSDPIPEEPPYRTAIQGAKNLDRQCAYAILLFREKYEVDGLSANELEKILTKRMNIRTTRDTIARKLNKWGTHIDRIRHPKHKALTLYRLTAGGVEDIRNFFEIDSGRFQPKSVEDMMKDKD